MIEVPPGDHRSLRTVQDARGILEKLGAPPRLVRHGLLVAEAAELLLTKLRELTVALDESWVLAGAVLHDAGKIAYPAELDTPGAAHERAGESLLLSEGIEPHVAHTCVSHAAWKDPACSLEERLVALADALWKGVRRPALEALVIDAIACQIERDRWTVFIELDTCFESIADGASDRLRRSE